MNEHIKSLFIGADLEVTNAEGNKVRRIYMDSAASTLALSPAQDAAKSLMRFYSNTHSSVHLGARVCNEAMKWARNVALEYVGGNQDYSVVFLGSGATAPINRVAKGLVRLRPERNKVLVSLMEHHSNDLPHRQESDTIHISPYNLDGEFVGLDLEHFESLLKTNEGRINYVAVTAASNVTGHLTPIYDMAEIAHRYGAYILVDGAQIAAHANVKIAQDTPERSIDFFVVSGHKMYAPGSPGVLIANSRLLADMEPELLGGGMVEDVSKEAYTSSASVTDREHAGTINIPGIFSLAATMKFLNAIGLNTIYEKEKRLVHLLLESLSKIDGLKIYANKHLNGRIGAISFNIAGVPHELLARILNDYFGIAVRSGCFCAHPFVRESLVDELWDLDNEQDIINYQGMVRVSLGLYNDESDVKEFIAAIEDIVQSKEAYMNQYVALDGGGFEHKSFTMIPNEYFNIQNTVKSLIEDHLELAGVKS